MGSPGLAGDATRVQGRTCEESRPVPETVPVPLRVRLARTLTRRTCLGRNGRLLIDLNRRQLPELPPRHIWPDDLADSADGTDRNGDVLGLQR